VKEGASVCPGFMLWVTSELETGGRIRTDGQLFTDTLRVRAALQRVDGRYVLSEPKTGRSRRTLPLPPGVARVLQARRTEQSAERLAAGTEWSEPLPGLVFTTAFGAPRCPTALTHTFARLLQRHGFAPRTFHGLRHAHATLALSGGVDLKTLSAMLGHSSIRLTADTYADVLPSMSRDAAARMDAVLTG
jgi:integrase